MIETIVGKRGRGKTSLVAEILARKKRDQIFIFDYCAEFREFEVPGFCYIYNTDFPAFCHDTWNYSRDGVDTLMVLDEVHIYSREKELCKYIDHITRIGRHKGIDVLSTSQRFVGLPLSIRSATDVYYVFQLTEIRDMEFLKNYISQDVLNVITGLNQFEYITLSL